MENTENTEEELKCVRIQTLDKIRVLTDEIRALTDELNNVDKQLVENGFQITKKINNHGYTVFQITNEFSQVFIPELKMEWFKHKEIQKCINQINKKTFAFPNNAAKIYDENCYDYEDDVTIRSLNLSGSCYQMTINYLCHTYIWTVKKDNLLFLLNFIYEKSE